MGGQSSLVATVGADQCGALLTHALIGADVESDLMVRKAATTSKVRFINGAQQMMRPSTSRKSRAARLTMTRR